MQYFATQNLMLKLNSVVDKGQNKQKKKNQLWFALNLWIAYINFEVL